MVDIASDKFSQGGRKFHKDRMAASERPIRQVGKSLIHGSVEAVSGDPLLQILLPKGVQITQVDIYIQYIYEADEEEVNVELLMEDPKTGQKLQPQKVEVFEGYFQPPFNWGKLTEPLLLTVTPNFKGRVIYSLTYTY